MFCEAYQAVERTVMPSNHVEREQFLTVKICSTINTIIFAIYCIASQQSTSFHSAAH
jgi:hypothetical protein